MNLTLTCDHRTIDGAIAADFLRTVKTFLEEPGLAL
jgi:pyruvate dehydrogenase E2 component (dihydrolipoamide acetyltransferase)